MFFSKEKTFHSIIKVVLANPSWVSLFHKEGFFLFIHCRSASVGFEDQNYFLLWFPSKLQSTTHIERLFFWSSPKLILLCLSSLCVKTLCSSSLCAKSSNGLFLFLYLLVKMCQNLDPYGQFTSLTVIVVQLLSLLV